MVERVQRKDGDEDDAGDTAATKAAAEAAAKEAEAEAAEGKAAKEAAAKEAGNNKKSTAKEEVIHTPRVTDDPKAAAAAPRVTLPDPEEETVRMMFPKAVKLQEAGIMHTFEAGVQRVRRSLVDHWWLKQNGVVKADD